MWLLIAFYCMGWTLPWISLSNALSRRRYEGFRIEETSEPDSTRPQTESYGCSHRLGDALELLHTQAEVVDPLNDSRVRWDLVQNPGLG